MVDLKCTNLNIIFPYNNGWWVKCSIAIKNSLTIHYTFFSDNKCFLNATLGTQFGVQRFAL